MSLEYRSFSDMSNCYEWTLQKAMNSLPNYIKPHRSPAPSISHQIKDTSQNVRKSRRLEEKEKKRAERKSSISESSVSNNKRPPKKSVQEAQFERTFTQRLSDPKIVSNVQIMWKDGAFWYSIDVKEDEACIKHSQKDEDSLSEQIDEKCLKCRKQGTYWLKAAQLRRINNGAYWRKFIEKQIF